MSKYSIRDPLTGEWGDLVIRRPDPETRHRQVFVGDRNIGQIAGPTPRSRFMGWWACSTAQPPRLQGLRSYTGFHSMLTAAFYLVEVGVYLPRNHCVAALDWHAEPGYPHHLCPQAVWPWSLPNGKGSPNGRPEHLDGAGAG